MATRPLSPAARGRLHDGCLWWAGVLLLLVLVTLGWWVPAPRDHPGGIAFAVVLLAAVVALVVGFVRGRRSAAAFNDRDDAFADALTRQLGGLRQYGRVAAYAASPEAATLTGCRLVETARRLDQQTTPWTTRASLLGDAVFAVVEAPLSSGAEDTFRVLAPSTGWTAGWLSDLVVGAAQRLGGPTTHAGSTVLGWRTELVAGLVPADVPYLSDRLSVLGSRPPGQRGTLQAQGSWVGRNALLASSVQLGTEPPLDVVPLGFPVLLDRAIGLAAAEAERPPALR